MEVEKILEMISALGAEGKQAFIAYLVFRVSAILTISGMVTGVALIVRNILLRLIPVHYCNMCKVHRPGYASYYSAEEAHKKAHND